MKNKLNMIAGCVCLLLCGMTVHANLLLDPGFEMETQYSPWASWDDTGRADWAKRDGFTGAYFRDWNDFGDGPPHSGGFYQEVEVTPGKPYAFSIWVRKEAQFSAKHIKLTVQYFNTKYHVLETRESELAGTVTTEWNRYGLTSTAPRGAVTARVMMTFEEGGSERGKQRSCLFDDAVFEPVNQ
jgi:hypothetical protein